MKKAMLVSVVVMVCAAIALAQETPSGGAAGQNTSQTPSATQTTPEENGNAIQGCLTGSTGNYVLTDSAGVAYKIQGDESQLADYVNKEVEVMGTIGSSAAASAGEHAGQATGEAAGEAAGHAAGEAGHAAGEAAGEAAHASKTLEVSSVKKIADSCSMNK